MSKTCELEEDELIMLTLLTLDSENMVQITSGGEVVAIFAKESLGTYLTQWRVVKQKLATSELTQTAYEEWKKNWLQTVGKDELCC